MSRLDYWNRRATLGPTSGTEDRIAKELEVRYLSRWLTDTAGFRRGKPPLRVLDAGCGNGETLVRLQEQCGFEAWGCDFSGAMLERAMDRQISLNWFQHDLRRPLAAQFDVIYTERALINLPSREEQLRAITHMGNALVPGGLLILVECSADGLAILNRTRARVGLEPIQPPWHNTYLWADDVQQAGLHAWLRFVRMDYYSDTYYFLSRVVEAMAAQQEGRAPRYDSVINQLALSIDVEMDVHLGQGRAWVFRKP